MASDCLSIIVSLNKQAQMHCIYLYGMPLSNLVGKKGSKCDQKANQLIGTQKLLVVDYAM